MIFTMDEGTRLLENPILVSLAGLEGVSLSACPPVAPRHLRPGAGTSYKRAVDES